MTIGIFAPAGRDAIVIRQILGSAKIDCAIVAPTNLIAGIIDYSLSAAVLTEEALLQLPQADVLQCLADQPPWSDFPFIILRTPGNPPQAMAALMHALGNVTQIERPVHPATLVSAARSGRRARMRQLDAQRYLDDRERAEEQIRLLAATLEQRVADRTSALVEMNARLTAEVTERLLAQEETHRMQAQLIHVSRVSAMGAMGSTLAHELNQPLTAVINYISAVRHIVASLQTPVPEIVSDGLDAAVENAFRAGEIIRHLRELVVRREVQRRPENVASLIQDAVSVALLDAAEHGIEYLVDLDPDLPLVLADRIQIEQVIINLLRNAVQALKDAPVRRIAIRGQLCCDMVEISVSDTGNGLPPHILTGLFTPFATTKPEGMGIGLSISRTIVEASGGSITGANRAEGGAIFSFTIPLAPPAVQQTRPSS